MKLTSSPFLVSKNNLLAGAGLSPEAIQKVVKSQCLKLNEFYALKELSSTLDEVITHGCTCRRVCA